MDKTRPSVLLRLGNQFDWISSILFLVFAFIVGVDLQNPTIANWPDFILKAVKYLQTSALWLALAGMSLGVVHVFVKRSGALWVNGAVKFVLDELQQKAYSDFERDRDFHHRVTVFRHKRVYFYNKNVHGNRWWEIGKGRSAPWSGWVVPIMRSGHDRLNTNAIFKAPNNGQESEGVVGYAWDSGSITVASNLPRIDEQSKLKRRKEYAKKTFCCVSVVNKSVENGKKLPRSIGAIPIYVKGEKWGVLVLDSQEPKAVTEEVLDNFTVTVKVIGKLLEKSYD